MLLKHALLLDHAVDRQSMTATAGRRRR